MGGKRGKKGEKGGLYYYLGHEGLFFLPGNRSRWCCAWHIGDRGCLHRSVPWNWERVVERVRVREEEEEDQRENPIEIERSILFLSFFLGGGR